LPRRTQCHIKTQKNNADSNVYAQQSAVPKKLNDAEESVLDVAPEYTLSFIIVTAELRKITKFGLGKKQGAKQS
jgi:hypothetical protein